MFVTNQPSHQSIFAGAYIIIVLAANNIHKRNMSQAFKTPFPWKNEKCALKLAHTQVSKTSRGWITVAT